MLSIDVACVRLNCTCTCTLPTHTCKLGQSHHGGKSPTSHVRLKGPSALLIITLRLSGMPACRCGLKAIEKWSKRLCGGQ